MSNTIHTPSPSASSSPYATAASAKDNASRLRENQRRSRARKKEYLTSLETRFQACQRTGIEANVEIQNAAKRVVRENLLLREMLRNRGVGDDEIDRVIREGGEGSINGESAVEGVMKVLGRRPCGGEPLSTEKLVDERYNDRRNSTGMIAARDAGDRTTRGGETSCPPATGSGGCASAKCSPELPLSLPSPVLPPSAHHRAPRPPPHPPAFTPQHYPSPSGTPTSVVPTYALPVSAPQLNSYYTFSSPLPPPSQSYTVTSPTYPPSNVATAGYQQFYPPPPQSTSSQSSPSCCYPPQQQQQQQQQQHQQQYQNSCSTSTTPCHLAQTFIQQLHPQDSGQLVSEICPPEAMDSGNCHVETNVLFNLLDKI
ncbi:hypothetical protein L873DRAFT_1759367 [Choiromyces venosus 120613-1]|uniref:BZIP domain-containing protein n=1 Tax=Choiromyces venosus 120613-1 TaxID=1336337 RepID=A0A3N4K0P0_9PEZI|nr:hypothetical protein L873DRAFT_1759367 [Choiromyces venosus 120613-1]